MGRSVVFAGQTLIVPDAYSQLNLDALLQPASGGVGIVALVGESDGGAPGVHLFPGGTSSTLIKRELKSGPGADMTRLALRAGDDPDVPAGASQVLFVKTNQSTQATVALSTKGTLRTKQYGVFTNAYTAFISALSGGSVLTVKENSPDANSIVEMSPVVGVDGYFSALFTPGAASAATATLSYVAGVLRFQTTLTGAGPGENNLDINCTGLTVTQLVNLINQNTGYTAAVLNGKGQVLVSNLDLLLVAASIFNTTVSFKAGFFELMSWATSTSLLVTVERAAGNAGDVLPSPYPATGVLTFAGGSRGASTNSQVQAAFNLLLAYRVNVVVPLFSYDSQDGSTITIASINSQLKDHVTARSSLLGRSEAQGNVSIRGNKAAFIAECARMGSMLVSVSSQRVTDLNIDGTLVKFDEYAFAVIAAQTQVGSPIGTPLENKLIPSSAIENDVSWSFIVDGPELLLKGALLAMVDENNQIRIKGGYSSWLGDDNNGRIFIETVESLLIFSYNHRRFMRQRFVGKSNFTSGDVLQAILESETAERDTTKSIKGFTSKNTKIISGTGAALQYEVDVTGWEGTRFVLPTVIATRNAA